MKKRTNVEKYFKTPLRITASELVSWFIREFTDLTNEMKASDHAVHKNEPNPFHVEGDVWTHTMLVLQRAAIEQSGNVNLIAALLHDVGKAVARNITANKDTGEFDRARFIGHEGTSVYKSVKPLNALRDLGVITEKEMNEILLIISHHGNLFDRIKDGEEYKPQKVTDKFRGCPDIFGQYIKQVKYDSLGRFHTDVGGRPDQALHLGKEIYGENAYERLMISTESFESEKSTLVNKNTPTITVLVGVPLSGKSTYLKDNEVNASDASDAVIISRDSEVMKYASEKGIEGTYSEIWKALSPEDHGEVDEIVQKHYQDARQARQDIIIDMTNTSPKSRRKWLSGLKNYRKRAIFFVTDYAEIMKRNHIRSEEEGKIIPEAVIQQMMKNLTIPMYDEVHELKFVHIS